MSLICDASRNFRPPNFTTGICLVQSGDKTDHGSVGEVLSAAE
jgi:hypothetical protein